VGQSATAAAWDDAANAEPAVVPQCRKCGRTDSTLRASAFSYALSAVVITLRRPGSDGIFCGSCRRTEAIKWSLLTGVLGWWGFPWGPVFSVQSIFRNLKGGLQDKDLNAKILGSAGEALADRGETTEAIRALEQASKLRDDPATAALLGRVRGY
jgi:hypothetical protein